MSFIRWWVVGSLYSSLCFIPSTAVNTLTLDILDTGNHLLSKTMKTKNRIRREEEDGEDDERQQR